MVLCSTTKNRYRLAGLLAVSWLVLAGPAPALAETRNRTQVFVAGLSDDLSHKAGTITNVLRKVMTETPKVEVLDLSNQLKAEAPAKVSEYQATARKELVEAKKALRDMDHGEAVTHAKKAREAFEKMGGYLDPLERYKETLLLIGVGNSMLGNIKQAKNTFLDLLLLDPHLKLPKTGYEGFVIELFEQVRSSLAQQALGSLSVRTEPPGANLYLDGKLKGVTPESMDGVIAGAHLVVIKAPGFENWGKVARVQPGEHEVLQIKLTPGQGGSGFMRMAERACKVVSDDAMRGEVLRLGSTIGLDWALLGQLRHDSYDLILRVYLFEFSRGVVIFEDELVMDSTGYGMEEDVRGFASRFMARSLKEITAFREQGDPLSGKSGTEDWNRDASGADQKHRDTKAQEETERKNPRAEEGDPLDDVDGTEDW